jgi:hypothetical protein
MTNIVEVTRIEHNIVGVTDAGEYKIKFTNTNFSDIILSIYGVEFIEGDDNANMSFNYDIHEGTVPDDRMEEFKTLMGDFLVQAITEGLEKNELVYHGGIDENRTNDTEQSGI